MTHSSDMFCCLPVSHQSWLESPKWPRIAGIRCNVDMWWERGVFAGLRHTDGRAVTARSNRGRRQPPLHLPLCKARVPTIPYYTYPSVKLIYLQYHTTLTPVKLSYLKYHTTLSPVKLMYLQYHTTLTPVKIMYLQYHTTPTPVKFIYLQYHTTLIPL